MSSKFGLNPWATIWTQPKKTIRAIVENNPKYHFFYLATIYALQTMLFLVFSAGLIQQYNIATVLIACIVIAPFAGALFLCFNAWVLHFTGKWLKGNAPYLHVRAALSWSKVPNIIPVLMWFVLLVFSSEVFMKKAETATILFIDLITIISGIWVFIILLKNIQEIQKFSIWRSFFNIIIAFVISYAILLILRSTINYLIIFFSS